MPVPYRYCAERSDLEHRYLLLVSHFVDLLELLQGVIGRNHEEFLAVRGQCDATRSEIAECRSQIRDHRAQHGC